MLQGRGHQRPRRLGAEPRVVRGAERRVPRVGAPGRRQGPRLDRGRPRPRPGASTSATTAAASRSSTSVPPPTTRPCSASSASPPSTPSPPPRTRSRRSETRTASRGETEDMTDTTPTAQLSAAGVSIWLDDLSRERITSGGLAEADRREERRRRHHQPDDLRHGPRQGRGLRRAGRRARRGRHRRHRRRLRDHDRRRRRRLRHLPRRSTTHTNGVDGRVSIEVEPGLAHDAAGHHRRGQEALRPRSTSPNVLIKIPATVEGLEAITETIAAGISVNVTLIFSLAALPRRHQRLPHRPREGQGRRHRPVEHPLGRLVLRVARRHRDRQAPRAPSAPTRRSRSRARPASPTPSSPTRSTSRRSPPSAPRRSLAAGANEQRPLWASTGVKDPSLPDTLYVTELVAPDVVNTMPEKTLDATFDHGVITGDTVTRLLRRRQRGARRDRRARHLLRRGHRAAREGGRREVHRLLERAARHRHRRRSRPRSELQDPRDRRR